SSRPWTRPGSTNPSATPAPVPRRSPSWPPARTSTPTAASSSSSALTELAPGAGVADGFVPPGLVLVLPDDGRLELDRIIDEGEVGQQSVALEHADPVRGIEGGDLGGELTGPAAQASPLRLLLLGGEAGLGADLLLLGGDQEVLGAQRGHRLGALVGEGL